MTANQKRDRSRKIEELFDQVSRLPNSEREDFLTLHCQGDSLLRQEIESLVRFDQEDSSIFDAADDASQHRNQPQEEAKAPEQIGNFKIQSLLGKGGMGEVYLGQQEKPIKRLAAIKLVRSGIDSQKVLERFRLEQNTLALMDHASIAKIFEAGATSEGIPFFAMEYVEGQAITEYCDQHQLGIAARLKIFKEVCMALHHAHQKGIIHRDIKPSNIIVFKRDGEALPKLIDFGIAKAVAQEANSDQQLTQDGQLLGTVDYMSPEQAEFGEHDLDTRSDIYSLGVLLYELLVGRLPFESNDSDQRSFAESLKYLCEKEPTKPSLRLTENTAKNTSTANLRNHSNRSLASELRGDLDCITMMALRKKREHRYNSAAAFASDIDAYLQSEPIMAMPPSRFYRAKKFFRKNKWSCLSACSFLLALLAAFAICIHLYQDTKEQYVEIIQLSDFQRLEQCRNEAARLVPPSPEILPELEALLKESKLLAARLETHRENLSRLREQSTEISAAELKQQQDRFPGLARIKLLQKNIKENEIDLTEPNFPPVYAQLYQDQIKEYQVELDALLEQKEHYREYSFGSTEQKWHHNILTKLIKSLEEFTKQDSLEPNSLADINRRYEFVKELKEIEKGAMSANWKNAIESIKKSSKYAGLEISPQRGLTPIGENPQSGLWEFSYTPSGRLTSKAQDNAQTSPAVEDSLTFILMPGGSYQMGARSMSFGVQLDVRTLKVLKVMRESLLDLKLGDQITHFNKKAVTDLHQLGSEVLALKSNQECSYTLIRDGASVTKSFIAEDKLDHFARSYECPAHEVKLKAFFISKYEMTQAQWHRLTNSSPSFYSDKTVQGNKRHTLAHPVDSISYLDCMKALPRWGLTLPTEAQWEYAARGGKDSIWFCGDTVASIDGYGNLADHYAYRCQPKAGWPFEHEVDDGYLTTSPVGIYKANPYGLHDTIGNVAEWCLDPFWQYDKAKHRVGDGFALGPSTSEYIIRGGCFWDRSQHCRSASRSQFDINRRSGGGGVRPARALEE